MFSYLYDKVLCLRWVSRPIRILLKWKGRVCELLAIIKGDTDANKILMGGGKLKEYKVILWSTLHDFKIICPKGV